MSSIRHHVEMGLFTHQLEHFEVRSVVLESDVLRGNPLGDPYRRVHPVLVPKGPAPQDGYPVVFVLAGFTGNGPNYFNVKAFELSAPEVIDQARSRAEAPASLFVFVDAMTSWGGSQFLNSPALGRYEDYVGGELVQAVRSAFQTSPSPSRWCVAGGSSGGYGALHLSSRYPEVFGLCAAIAPDSFFEASLLPEIWTALPTLTKLGGVSGVRTELREGRFMKRRESHSVLNAIAMGLCYAPGANGEPEWPVDPRFGVVREDVWSKWKRHDPIVFLRERRAHVARLERVFLDVGTRDQFHLQYGTRQIHRVLEEIGVSVDVSEFDGNHFEIGERRPLIWKWLTARWSPI